MMTPEVSVICGYPVMPGGVMMVMPGAKRSSTSSKPRRVVPSAERRLRASFPEVWAWYELLVTARGKRPVERVLDEAPVRRRSANR